MARAVARLRLTALLMGGALLIATATQAASLPAAAYENHAFTDPSFQAAVQSTGELSGGRRGTTGWVQYR
ncbi:MAG: hypothetical protein LBE59_06435, partial [Nevskiaceae bacterium]|nr:hypothetical protein [Nevskiaceae bacterium]